MNSPVHVEKYKGFNIQIFNDFHPESPREWDNLGQMLCYHRRYLLGDQPNNISLEDAIKMEKDHKNECLPIYLYDHSGLTVSTTPFHCPWDSGKLGVIVVTPEKMRKEFGVKRITKEHRLKTREILAQEVKTYDQYLTGRVYGYVVADETGNDIDSCWGIYDDYDGEYILGEARLAIDSYLKGEEDKIAEHIKNESLELQLT